MEIEGKIVPIQDARPYVVRPAMSVDEALVLWEEYQDLKTKVGVASDFQEIRGKMHPKKSFVRKAQKFFGVSCEILRDEVWTDLDGNRVGWIFTVRAIHPATGLYQDADGSCESIEKEKGQDTLHNVRAHALTRAKNRAILDLVGFGEVSAEEIIEEKKRTRGAPTRRRITKAQANALVKRAGETGGDWTDTLRRIIAEVKGADPEMYELDAKKVYQDELAAINGKLAELEK
jgi:hypothetical protein